MFVSVGNSHFTSQSYYDVKVVFVKMESLQLLEMSNIYSVFKLMCTKSTKLTVVGVFYLVVNIVQSDQDALVVIPSA